MSYHGRGKLKRHEMFYPTPLPHKARFLLMEETVILLLVIFPGSPFLPRYSNGTSLFFFIICVNSYSDYPQIEFYINFSGPYDINSFIGGSTYLMGELICIHSVLKMRHIPLPILIYLFSYSYVESLVSNVKMQTISLQRLYHSRSILCFDLHTSTETISFSGICRTLSIIHFSKFLSPLPFSNLCPF